MFKYATKTIKKGYDIIKDALPVIHIARQSLDSMSPNLPNVSFTMYIERFLNEVTAELKREELTQTKQSLENNKV